MSFNRWVSYNLGRWIIVNFISILFTHSLYSDAQEKLANLRMERDTQTESVRRQLKDLHYSAEREERFKKEMEVGFCKKLK